MTSTQFNINDYLNVIRRRLPLFLKVAVPVVFLGVALALILPDTYRSTAEFRIDLQGPGADVLEPIAVTNYADQYIGALRQRITTRDQLEAWLDEFNLYPNRRDTEARSLLVARMTGDIRIENVTTQVMAPGAGRAVDLITGFQVSFDSPDPVSAQQVAERLAAEFIKEDRVSRTEQAATASSFLQEQIELRREEILILESKLAEFKELHAGTLPELMALNMTVVDRMERELEVIQNEIRSLQQDRIFRSAQLQEIVQRSASGAQLMQLEQEYLRMTAMYAADHPDLIRVKRQIAALTAAPGVTSGSAEVARLEAELAAARQRYSDEHPDVLRLTRQVEAARADHRGALSSVRTGTDEDPIYLQLRAQVNAIDSRVQGLQEREREVRVRLADAEERIARTPQVEREYQALNRDLESARATLRNLQDRLAIAQQTEALESTERGARITLVRRPYVPEFPAGPPRTALMMLSVFLALALGGMVAVLAEGLDSTVRGSRDIYALLQTQPIGTVPIMVNSVSRAASRRRMLLYAGGAMLLIAAASVIVRMSL